VLNRHGYGFGSGTVPPPLNFVCALPLVCIFFLLYCQDIGPLRSKSSLIYNGAKEEWAGPTFSPCCSLSFRGSKFLPPELQLATSSCSRRAQPLVAPQLLHWLGLCCLRAVIVLMLRPPNRCPVSAAAGLTSGRRLPPPGETDYYYYRRSSLSDHWQAARTVRCRTAATLVDLPTPAFPLNVVPLIRVAAAPVVL
jgi:hypothetical protein